MKNKLPPYDQNKVLELYESMGYALWMIQSLELSLNHYLVFALKISVSSAGEQIREIFEQTSKKTLGSLISDLKKNDEIIDKTIVEKLEDIVIRRNWLVHKVYAINQSDMFSEVKSAELIDKIRNIGFDAIKLSTVLSNKADYFAIQKRFFTKEELDKRTQEILDSWIR